MHVKVCHKKNEMNKVNNLEQREDTKDGGEEMGSSSSSKGESIVDDTYGGLSRLSH